MQTNGDGQQTVLSGIQDREPREAGTTWGLSRGELVGGDAAASGYVPLGRKKGKERPLQFL